LARSVSSVAIKEMPTAVERMAAHAPAGRLTMVLKLGRPMNLGREVHPPVKIDFPARSPMVFKGHEKPIASSEETASPMREGGNFDFIFVSSWIVIIQTEEVANAYSRTGSGSHC